MHLRVQQKPVLASEQEALGPLAAVAGVLASASRSGCLWARLRGRLVPFDAGTIEPLLSAERSIHAEDPGGFTHVFSLSGTPRGPGEVGVVLVNVRPAAVAGAAPGMVVSVSLDGEVFDTGADAVLRTVGACLDALSPDSVMVGPADFLRELRAGWATFARTVHRELLPAGAKLDPTHDGALVVAHAEDPASASDAARGAIAQVHTAIVGPAPREAQAQQPAPVVSLQRPAYLVPPPIVLDGVSSRVRAPAELSGTSLAVKIPSGPILPFVAPAPTGPELTLEQYAVLRAELMVKGEDDPQTLRLFGVTSRAAKEALQARFAERFRQDGAAQARFVELVRTLTSGLRGQTPTQ